MIRIYDKEEKLFTGLGLGSLDETTAAIVAEELNGSYEMEMEYPITGRHFDDIKIRNIIFCKPNSYTSEQPFRIYAITKPLAGIVTVNAAHISYDASGVTMLPTRDSEKGIIPFGDKVIVDDKEGYYLDTILRDLNLAAAIPSKNYFTVIRNSDKKNVFKEEGFSLSLPKHLRAVLGGDDTSLLSNFQGEYLFDKFNIYLCEKRGSDRGITIRYGKNMTELEQETDGNNLFTGIFPFYSKAYTESFTSTSPVYLEAYIVTDITPLRSDWLSTEVIDISLGIGGVPFSPVVELMKVAETVVEGILEVIVEKIVATKIKTDGIYEDRLFAFKQNSVDLGNLINAYVTQTEIINVGLETEQTTITQLAYDAEGLNIIDPLFGIVYVIKSDDSEFFNRKFIFDKEEYVQYNSDGFYVEVSDSTILPEVQKKALVDTYGQIFLPNYKISYDEINSIWVEDPEGEIYVRPYKPNVGTVTVDKYVYLDLINANPIGTQWFNKETSTLYTSVTKNTWIGATEVVLPVEEPTGPFSIGTQWFKELTNTLYTSITEDTWVGATEVVLPVIEPSIMVPESPIIFEEGMLYVNEELKNLGTQRILTLDLTSDMDDIGGLTPQQMTISHLFNKAEQYLKDNDVTKVNETVTISFIKLSDSPEYAQFKQLEVVQLGDEISVIHEKLGVNSKKRVISTQYNVLTGAYDEIELGDKVSKITNNIVTTGDNISSLKNDSNFANKQYITQLVAENADIVNAEIQNAVIKTLEVANVNVSGLLQASRATIDNLVAQLFTTDYAQVAKALIAGSVRVKGDLTLDSGSITIKKVPSSAYDSVYIKDGEPALSKTWLSLSTIPGHEWTHVDYSDIEIIGDFNVSTQENIGVEMVLDYININYPSDNYDINSTIVVLDADGFYIQFVCESIGIVPLDPTTYNDDAMFRIKTDGYNYNEIYKWNNAIESYVLASTYVFSVDRQGNVVANALTITGGSISIGNNFHVSNGGILTARGVRVIDGEISINQDRFKVNAQGEVIAKALTAENLYSDNIYSENTETKELMTDRIYLSSDKQVYMERVTGDNIISQTVVLTGTVAYGELLGDNVTYHGYLRLDSSFTLYETKTFDVTLTYFDNYGSAHFITKKITITKGNDTGDNLHEFYAAIGSNGSIGTVKSFPESYVETKLSGEASSVIINVYGTQYDIITGIISANEGLNVPISPEEPDLELYTGNFWIAIEEE